MCFVTIVNYIYTTYPLLGCSPDRLHRVAPHLSTAVSVKEASNVTCNAKDQVDMYRIPITFAIIYGRRYTSAPGRVQLRVSRDAHRPTTIEITATDVVESTFPNRKFTSVATESDNREGAR